MLAYATGHLANDLVIAIWSSYSTLFLNKVIMLSDYYSGLVVLMGQIIDAFCQPIVSYASDNIDTPFGKRMPWYFFGNLVTLPCFYLLFNPPDWAIGSENTPDPSVWFFLIVPGIMNIGQGAIQLSHMSIVNSITYDQKRRDILINMRNSCSYAAGIIVPALSFYMFTHIESDNDQFAYIANICCFMGLITSTYFMFTINEPKLVEDSKRKYDSYFMIQAEDPDSDGKVISIDSEEEEVPPHFGAPTGKEINKGIRKEDSGSSNGLQAFFDQAKQQGNDRRGTVSIGGLNFQN